MAAAMALGTKAGQCELSDFSPETQTQQKKKKKEDDFAAELLKCKMGWEEAEPSQGQRGCPHQGAGGPAQGQDRALAAITTCPAVVQGIQLFSVTGAAFQAGCDWLREASSVSERALHSVQVV